MRSVFLWTLLCSLSIVAPSYCHAAPLIQWFKSFGSDAAMTSGGPIVGANSDTAYVWLKSGSGTILHRIDGKGTTLWTRPVDLPDFDNYRISVDDPNNAYLSWGSADWHIQKYSASGDVVWTNTYGTLSIDRPYAGVATDSSGNIYLGGSTFGNFAAPNQGRHDSAISQLDANGNALWSRQWGTPSEDVINSLIVDNLGNVLVGEQKTDSPGALPSSTTVRKLSASGDLLWTRQFSGFGSISGVDDSGNAYVRVRPPGAAINDSDIVKLSPNGDLLWTRDVNAFGGVVDAHGNSYLTRWKEAELVKYNPEGVLLWTLPLTGGAPGDISSIDVDDLGNVFVSGRTLSPSGVALDVWLARVVEQVPEPSAMSLFLGGLALAIVCRSRRKSPETQA